MTDFPGFFSALWRSEKWPQPEPFPWQTLLGERAARGEWPLLINLPTASGKTACLDAAVFGLAATAGRRREERLPRRIWFVVDRRIVVDEAFERASMVASKLGAASEGPVREVAEALRSLSGTGRPLGVARLRGGVWLSQDWARSPTQPTIICSTVDQVGSALLFRAYGHSDQTASIYAGLAAQDSLIILDEAHCAVPFMQTLDAVARYRGGRWAERPLKTPFRYCVMSATPPDNIPEVATFPAPSERAAALDHPRLQRRMGARKLAALQKPVKGGDDEFADEAAALAGRFRAAGRIRIAVMVNRVDTARKIAGRLREQSGAAADVVLFTGRMRPLDRDVLVGKWKDLLKAGSVEQPKKPVVVVTTQCLEVGADFSFDALVTECAGLDALRQRFGRLDRLGDLGESPAAILIRDRDTKQANTDPIYGKAIYETWTWLNEPEQRRTDGSVDLGVAVMDGRAGVLRDAEPQRFRKLLAPWEDAPVLLPTHLDLLCQTSPRPTPEPDVALFLHGKGQPVPEVRVVFRADLKGADDDFDILSLVPPTSPEMLSVPVHRLKEWLLHDDAEDTDGDVEGSYHGDEEREENRNSPGPADRRFAIWRGREKSEVTSDTGRLRANDVVVLRSSAEGMWGLGQTIESPEGLGPGCLDLAERAFSQARGRAVLRVHREVLAPLTAYRSVADLLALADSEPQRDEVQAALQAVLEEDETRVQEPGPKGFLSPWLKSVVASLQTDGRMRIDEHPDGGLVLTGRSEFKTFEQSPEEDRFADALDLTSEAREPVSLREHAAAVAGVAGEFAARCADDGFRNALVAAAGAHDLGKLDWRFQLLLRGGDWAEMSSGEALAKSADLPERKGKRDEIEEDARLPRGFRHEFLSMQIAEHFGLSPANEETQELVLHLIASHHGYARPFAPPVRDDLVAAGRGGELCLKAVGMEGSLSARERRAMTPAHHIESGVGDRFWRLTRRYGWWGLAHLECLLRLSDWEASCRRRREHTESPGLGMRGARVFSPGNRIPFNAVDGANPLGFLAALGALRVLTRVHRELNPRLSWEQRLGAWRPALWIDRPADEARICDALHQNGLDIAAMFPEDLLAATVSASPKNKKGEASWIDKLKFPVDALREFCRAASDRREPSAEYAAAWAGETSTDRKDTNIAMKTRFDFTAGQQAFVGMVRELKKGCRPADLRSSLFTGWRYSTAAASMRWDTMDEKRQYALQSSDPTKGDNPPVADLGANFLAVEALPLFSIVPNRGAEQAGFDGKGDGRSWSWPIWTSPIGLETIRSLLALPLANFEEWPAHKRTEIGVPAVFQSRIVMPSGRYRCFTPARSV